MKTILLTSAGMNVKDEILKILPKPVEQIKIAHITTASNVEEDVSYVENDRQKMLALGLQVEDVDIAGKTENELRNILAGKDVIYVQGGNTFYLLKHIRESGFDKVVKELIEKSVIYIGVSAGSIVAGSTIETASWKGTYADPNDVGLADLTGMNLVDFDVFVHFVEEYKKDVEAGIAQSKCPVKILTDEQWVLVRDGKIETDAI